MEFAFAWPFLIPIIAIIGGCAIAIFATMAKARVREAEIRERIALIERGLVPPPEVDPRGFDRAIDRFDRAIDRHDHPTPSRFRRGGVILIGAGFGLMVLIGFTDDFQNGLGVGGFLVILGLAFFINSLFEGSQHRRWQEEPNPATPPERPNPTSPLNPTTPPSDRQ